MNHDQNNQPPSDPLAKRVLERIEKDHITPRPRWEFTLTNFLFWILGALSIVLGSAAFAAVLFEITVHDWQVESTTPDALLRIIPFFWIIAFGLFGLVGYINIRKTKRGYRYPLYRILLSAILASFLLGLGLFLIGFGEDIDEGLGDHPPFYRPALCMHQYAHFLPRYSERNVFLLRNHICKE